VNTCQIKRKFTKNSRKQVYKNKRKERALMILNKKKGEGEIKAKENFFYNSVAKT